MVDNGGHRRWPPRRPIGRTRIATPGRLPIKDTTMIRWRRPLPARLAVVAWLAVLATTLTANAAAPRLPADDTPWALVAWTPIPDNPVFTGTGKETWDRKIRERGFILVGEDGRSHLWYT